MASTRPWSRRRSKRTEALSDVVERVFKDVPKPREQAVKTRGGDDAPPAAPSSPDTQDGGKPT